MSLMNGLHCIYDFEIMKTKHSKVFKKKLTMYNVVYFARIQNVSLVGQRHSLFFFVTLYRIYCRSCSTAVVYVSCKVFNRIAIKYLIVWQDIAKWKITTAV